MSSTNVVSGRLWGCHNRQPYPQEFIYRELVELENVFVNGSMQLIATQIMKAYPFQNSRDCQYTKTNPTDVSCGDCRWKTR